MPQGSGPDSDSPEEMVLVEPPEVHGLNQSNASLIDVSIRDVSRLDQIAQPLRRVRIVFVVVGAQANSASIVSGSGAPVVAYRNDASSASNGRSCVAVG